MRKETQQNQNVNHLHEITPTLTYIPQIDLHKIYNIFKASNRHFIESHSQIVAVEWWMR